MDIGRRLRREQDFGTIAGWVEARDIRDGEHRKGEFNFGGLLLCDLCRVGSETAVKEGGTSIVRRVELTRIPVSALASLSQKVARYLKEMGMIPYYHNRKRLAPELEGGAIFVESLDEVSLAFDTAPFRFYLSIALLYLPSRPSDCTTF